MFSEVEPPQKKKKMKDSQLLSFSSLPDDITENILARVSRWSYPSLSLVCKKFRSLLSSMQIYKTRSQIGTKEICVYVCLQLPNQPYPSWFSLWSKPDQTRTKHRGKLGFKPDSSGNLVVPTPFSSSYSPPIPYDTVRVGSEIYIIGGPDEEPSTDVRILDCRSHTWRDAPSMTVARSDAFTVFLDEKIYVMGGCDIDKYSDNWFEVFDIKTQSWTALPGPGAEDNELRDQLSECYMVNAFEGKLYVVVGEKDYTYEPKDGTWKLVREQSIALSVEFWCGMGNLVSGCTYSRDLMWSASQGREWREIKGLEILLEHPTRGLKIGIVHKIFNYHGKLLVMWDPNTASSKISGTRRKNKIWYAKISLESRCNGRELWGNVECVDVLTFPGEKYEFLKLLTVSV